MCSSRKWYTLPVLAFRCPCDNRSPSVDLTRLRRPDVDVTRGLSGGGGMPRALEVASPRAKSRNRLVAGALVRWRARSRRVARRQRSLDTCCSEKALRSPALSRSRDVCFVARVVRQPSNHGSWSGPPTPVPR